ncbi:MAG: thiol peroxidase [Sulfurospirillaceae bacterium]|nr:thiol peroxidase [Sulfurospirillaceae bacterium]MCK9546806.1 thiol peroxidase [Sulfurospirillaceae bacterium]MDY0237748.1 thiol peroxidase [Campylobacterales bacterium]NLM99611.1 thiol peroxidase [Campylobacteraceae bacterium]
MVFTEKADYTALKGEKVKLGGNYLELGDPAPLLTLPNPHLEQITVGGEGNRIQVILSVPSFDTPVCAKESRVFNEKLAQIEGVEGILVSMDLPFAGARFCSTEGIENLQFVSDFKDKSFAKSYGVLISEGPLEGLCARAIFIVSKDGRVVYKQIVPEITDEPNYDEVLEKATAATKEGASCCGFCQ